ncbi:hypothetical protein SAMN05216582_12344 [Selenomonas ruminantium]|uniref:Uncharacterized protein n=1 Tax=Selenomonas ruminantium TaxID=971 RepID=A0A1M6WAB6_SELRU|nr:hypothetical protein SAMN05216582_12344 [Selenomonas ruminantium]
MPAYISEEKFILLCFSGFLIPVCWQILQKLKVMAVS